MRVTTEQVAERAGVSLKTVSRVVNGENIVSTMTRDRVYEIIGEPDLVPNEAARGLSRGKAMTIPSTSSASASPTPRRSEARARPGSRPG